MTSALTADVPADNPDPVQPDPAGRPLPALRRSRGGPLGALPRHSAATRRALAWCALLAAANSAALGTGALATSTALAAIVAGHHVGIGGDLGILAIAVAARAVLSWATRTVAARAAADAKQELRATLIDAALRRGPEWIAEYGPARLTAVATKGLDALDAYFTQYLPALVTAVVTPLAIAGWILAADWRSAVLVVVTVPLIPVFAILIGRYTQDRVTRAADATARLAGHLAELLRALPVLTVFRRAAAQAEAVRRVSEAHRSATAGTLRVAFLSALVLEMISTLSVALVAVGIGLRLVGGELGLATGLLVLILAPECYLPLRAAGSAHHASEDGVEAVRRVVEIAAAESTPVAVHSVGVEGSQVPKGVRPGSLRRQLRVSGLRVRRRGRHAPDGLSFAVRAGEITRLDLPSGAGKSTMLGVLLGFVSASAGTVTVDGVDLSTMDINWWRRQLAWVPQHPRFAADRVADELRLAVADLGGTPTDAELAAVAADTAAEQLLARPVGELSVGERQRVAVARALLRLRYGAWLLLLDEPTAHLDRTTAGRVSAAIQRAADAGAAVVLATHRGLVAATEPAEPAGLGETVTGDSEPETTHARSIPLSALAKLVDTHTIAGVLLGVAALGCGIALTGTAAWLIARAAEHPPLLTLTVAIVAVRAFGLAKGVLRYAERLVSHDAAFRLSGRLRVRLWQAVVTAGPVRTARMRAHDGVTRLVDDTDTVRDLVPRVVQPPLVAVLVVGAAVAVQTAILPAAGLLLAAAVLLAGFGAPLAALATQRHASARLGHGRRRVSVAVLRLLDTAADLLACGGHRARRVELARLDAELAGLARREALGAGVASGVVTGALGLASLGCVWLAAARAGAGTLNPVIAPVLALLPLALAETMDALPPAAQQLDVLRAAFARVTDVLRAKAAPAATHPDGIESHATESVHHAIDVHAVDVRWPGAAAPALRDVTLRVPAGAWVAVLGPSGAGKSTLLALLLGLLPPSRGTAALPADVAWSPQEPQLVSTTVRENLRLGDPLADDDVLRAALGRACLDGWADKLDVLLTAGGQGVSGGEAARLSLARALLRATDTQLVLLDEPTAHLDPATAERLLAGLRAGLAGRTVVHVTHRPAEAADADLVIEVDAGRVRVIRAALAASS